MDIHCFVVCCRDIGSRQPRPSVAPLDTPRDCIDKRKWTLAIAAQLGLHCPVWIPSAQPAGHRTNCGADRAAGLLFIRALQQCFHVLCQSRRLQFWEAVFRIVLTRRGASCVGRFLSFRAVLHRADAVRQHRRAEEARMSTHVRKLPNCPVVVRALSFSRLCAVPYHAAGVALRQHIQVKATERNCSDYVQ